MLKKYLGRIDEHPSVSMTLGLTVDMVSTLARAIYTDKMRCVLNKELTKIKKA